MVVYLESFKTGREFLYMFINFSTNTSVDGKNFLMIFRFEAQHNMAKEIHFSTK